MAGSGGRSESSLDPERGLHPPLSDPAKLGKVPKHHKLLCQSPQEPLPGGGITSAYGQKLSRAGEQSKVSGIFQQVIFGPQTQQQMETYTASEQSTSIPQGSKIQDGNTGNHQNRKYLRFHIQGQTYQFKALPFGLSTAPTEFTVIAKEVKIMATCKGIRIQQYLDDWLVRARSHQTGLQHACASSKVWVVNLEKSELELKQIFNFVGYQFDLSAGWVRTTLDWWQSLQEKIQTLLSLPACPVQQFMSLMGLLMATEKQVHLGRLHMRPIQWHLKNNWKVMESIEKVIHIPRSLHPYLQWWLEEHNVL